MTAKVHLLCFVRERKEKEDVELLIGVYDSESAALAAIDRLKGKPGFADFRKALRLGLRLPGVCPHADR